MPTIIIHFPRLQVAKVSVFAFERSIDIRLQKITHYEPNINSPIQFRETPAPELRQILAQLGFNWNNTRQAWQHPCGTFAEERADYDPRRRYGSRFAADLNPA